MAGGRDLRVEGNWLDGVIIGNSGHNVLDEPCGNDYMEGGAGNDTYHVDSARDVVREIWDGGHDTLILAASFQATGNLEDFVMVGSAHIDLTTTWMDNRIQGNAGNNRLNGGAGNATITGNGGKDVFAFAWLERGAHDVITDFTPRQDQL